MGLKALSIVKDTLDSYIGWAASLGRDISPVDLATNLHELKNELLQKISQQSVEQPGPEPVEEIECTCTPEMLDLPGCCESPACFRRIEPDFDILKDDKLELNRPSNSDDLPFESAPADCEDFAFLEEDF